MSNSSEDVQQAEFLAKAKLAMERSKTRTADEVLRPLIDKGIIDEDGQVTVDMTYAMPLTNGKNGAQRNGKH